MDGVAVPAFLKTTASQAVDVKVIRVEGNLAARYRFYLTHCPWKCSFARSLNVDSQASCYDSSWEGVWKIFTFKKK